jgi:glycine/D-amino acid oxidase-like deaminating enzyme
MSNRIEYRNGCLVEHPQACDCISCLDEWARWMEHQRSLDRLRELEVELRRAVPASDREWAAFLDAEFPRAGGAS